MNKIDTSLIVDPTKQQPFLGPSLEFLQRATANGVAAAVSGVFGRIPTLSIVILSGLTKSGNIIADGVMASLFAVETWLVTGADVTSYTNPPMLVPDNSFDAIDPVTFSDGSSESVHQIRRYKIADVSSGGILYSAVVFLQTDPATATLAGGFSGPINYYKDNTKNRVYLKGVLGAGYSTAVAFTLPTGLRPAVLKHIPIYFTVDGTPGCVILEVQTSGGVRVSAQPTGGTTYIYYLDEVSFFTEW